MKKHTLKAQLRTVVGRKTKKLRQEGLLPATIYGKKVKSVSVQLVQDEFSKVYQETGETGLIELALDGAARPVLVHNLQRDPVMGIPLHVEFLQVDLKEKVKTRVPLELVGDSPAVTQKLGVVLTLLDEVEVEALPTDLPEKITVDITGLAQVDQELKVSDLKLPGGVTVLTESSVTVVKIGQLVSKEAEAEAAAAAAAASEAAQAAAEAAPKEEGAPKEEQKPGEEPPAAPQEKKEETA